MDPRQFIKNSNVQVERPDTAPSIGQGVSSPIFNELRVGKFRPGIYNGVVNKLFTTDDKRLDIKYILKQRPKGHAPISNGITVDVNEIKGIYGRFQTGAIHTKDFGLKVRDHPGVLRITAANKMRTSRKINFALDFSGQRIQVDKIINTQKTNDNNRNTIKAFINKIGNKYITQDIDNKKPYFWTDVSIKDVLSLIDDFIYAPGNVHFREFRSEGDKSTIYEYIQDRKEELKNWDIYLPIIQNKTKTAKYFEKDIIKNENFPVRTRNAGGVDLTRNTYSPSENRQVESAVDKLIGLCDGEERVKPLLILHVMKCTGTSKYKGSSQNKPKPVFLNNFVTIGIHFPKRNANSIKPIFKSYAVNQTYYQQELALEINEIDANDEELLNE